MVIHNLWRIIMQIKIEDKSQPDWKALIAEQEISGLSQREFCRQRDLVLSQFVYYRHSSRKKDKTINPEPSLKPVRLTGNESSAISGDIRLSLPNGFQCSFPCTIETNQIRRLVEVLLSC